MTARQKMGSLTIPALAILAPLLAPVALGEVFINLAELGHTIAPVESAPAIPVSPDAPALSRVDAGATALERDRELLAPASAIPTTVGLFDMRVAAEHR